MAFEIVNIGPTGALLVEQLDKRRLTFSTRADAAKYIAAAPVGSGWGRKIRRTPRLANDLPMDGAVAARLLSRSGQ